MTLNIQTVSELDAFYEKPDPWNYQDNPDDLRRKNELLSLLPRHKYVRTLDIGCGDGFVTFQLPGEHVVGADLSEKAIQWAECNRQKRQDAERFSFIKSSVFDLDSRQVGQFDLVVITGVLYPQYIGRSFSVVREVIGSLLDVNGVVASCHIDEWNPPRFPYPLLDISLYPYRGYTHRLEIYKK